HGDGSGHSQLVDVDVLQQLVGSEPDVLQDFLATYLDAARRQSVELRSAVFGRDPRTARAVAHKLKSASRTVGAMALGELCAQLEKAGEAVDMPQLVRIMEAFDPAMAQVDAEIVSWLANGT
ncbi:MAG: Hpt domain-containing protein, partial [Burkholderiaceae bacterium]